MAAKYRVIYYENDAQERINIGVIAFNNTALHVRALRDWSRVEAFVGDDIAFLTMYMQQLTQHSFEFVMKSLIRPTGYGVKFTRERGSLKSAQELCEDVARIFLVENLNEAE